MIKLTKFRVFDGEKMHLVGDGNTLHVEDKGRWFLMNQVGDLVVNYTNESAVLMQYTGTKDKNEVPIHEGDILMSRETNYDHTCCDCCPDGCEKDHYEIFNKVIIDSINGVRIVGVSHILSERDFNNRVVSGNIYESPELLETKEDN